MRNKSAVEWARERAEKIVRKFPQIESEVLQPMLRREITIALLEARGFDKAVRVNGRRSGKEKAE